VATQRNRVPGDHRHTGVLVDQARVRVEDGGGLGPAGRLVDLGVLEAGPLGHPVDERLRADLGQVPADLGRVIEVVAQPWPAGEPVATGDDQLGRREGEPARVTGMPVRVESLDEGEGSTIAGADGPLKAAGIAAEPVEVRVGRQGDGHDGLLSTTRGPRHRAERRAVRARWCCTSWG
jgi:hypothetical protein